MLQIVIVDDSKEDLLLAERVLRTDCKIKNPITLCPSGSDAMDLLKKLQIEETPALIFLDLVMSPVSGLDVLSHWSKMEYAKDSMVVMVSALGDFNVITEGYQRGAKTFVLKPFSKEDMLQLLKGQTERLGICPAEDGYIVEWAGKAGDTTFQDRRSHRITTITA